MNTHIVCSLCLLITLVNCERYQEEASAPSQQAITPTKDEQSSTLSGESWMLPSDQSLDDPSDLSGFLIVDQNVQSEDMFTHDTSDQGTSPVDQCFQPRIALNGSELFGYELQLVSGQKTLLSQCDNDLNLDEEERSSWEQQIDIEEEIRLSDTEIKIEWHVRLSVAEETIRVRFRQAGSGEVVIRAGFQSFPLFNDFRLRFRQGQRSFIVSYSVNLIDNPPLIFLDLLAD